MQKTSLYIGRFQPFHLGHLDAVQQILNDGETEVLLIALGSAETEISAKNPLTTTERFQLIREVLQEAGISKKQYFIVPIRDVNNDDLWAKHVRQLLPPFSRVYSGSSLVRKLWQSEGDIEVRELKQNLDICATEVRRRLLAAENWQKLVPEATSRLVEEWGLKERLEELS